MSSNTYFCKSYEPKRRVLLEGIYHEENEIASLSEEIIVQMTKKRIINLERLIEYFIRIDYEIDHQFQATEKSEIATNFFDCEFEEVASVLFDNSSYRMRFSSAYNFAFNDCFLEVNYQDSIGRANAQFDILRARKKELAYPLRYKEELQPHFVMLNTERMRNAGDDLLIYLYEVD